MTTVNDLTGTIFGRLTVLRLIGSTEDHNRKVECVCNCGRRAIARVDNLRAGKTKSCGCIAAEQHYEKAMSAIIAEYGYERDAEVQIAICQALDTEDEAATPREKGDKIPMRMRFDPGTRRLLRAGSGVPYTLEAGEFARRVVEQEGVCAICSGPPLAADELFVDHCHATGRIRGLLCRRCNMGLGVFKDNIMTLAKAMKYLSTG